MGVVPLTPAGISKRLPARRGISFAPRRRVVHSPEIEIEMPIAKIRAISKNGVRAPSQPKRAATSLKIRETAFEDYHAITALQVRNGLVTRSFEDWAALWKQNPVYQRIHGDWPIGWVLETEDGSIVGSIGNIPMAYHFRGKER